MLEILVIIIGSGKVAEMAENKGYSGVLFRVLFILGWFFGAIMGAVVAAVASGGGAKGPDFCVLGVGYLLGGVLAIGAVTLLVAVLPEPTRERHYMDDYHEYQATGRVHDYRRDSDDEEDEDDRRPRGRYREDRDRDRDRRPRRDDPDDRPRRDDRYRADRRDDDDRPRRPRRRDEEY